MSRYLIAVFGIAGYAGLASAAAADLFADKAKDFGTTPRGPVLVHYFRFTNNTQQTLSLGQPRVSCGCVSAQAVHAQVAPGESSAIVAYMDTRRIPVSNTLRSVTVYVPFVAPGLEEVQLRVQTVCRDDLLMAPDTLAFGTLRKGQGGKATTKVTFTSDPNWQVTAAESTGGFIKPETKLVSREGSQVTYEISATLDAACPVGNWTADVHLTTSNAAVAKLRIPVTVTVSNPVAVSPEQVNLGDLRVGTAVEHKIIIQSSQPFKVLKVNGMDDQLAVRPEATDSKPTHVLLISATPKAVGDFRKTVEILTDSKEQPKIGLAVTGKVAGQ